MQIKRMDSDVNRCCGYDKERIYTDHCIQPVGGIVIGFVFAPKRIKHTTIGSHNGNGPSDDFFDEWEDSDDMEEDELSF